MGEKTASQTKVAVIERVKKGFLELRAAQSREEIRNALRKIGLADHELPRWLERKKLNKPH